MLAVLLLSLGIFLLAAAGLALGQFFGRPTDRIGCNGNRCGSCAACPNRNHSDEGGAS